jgi:hypothetical protein
VRRAGALQAYLRQAVVNCIRDELHDGIYISLRQFERERQRRPDPRRQVLVVFSDGVDNSSDVPYDDVLALARELDVTIYAITLQERTPGEVVFFDEFLRPRARARRCQRPSGWQRSAYVRGWGRRNSHWLYAA